ncbi:MAG: FAD-dependent oxidoreductase [Proteobacteria bacterium]|nr:FAD-dependent oxidoreductase [Pseudomonadota bacterium]
MEATERMHIIILGGGISGLSLAWKLCESGQEVTIIENSGFVGGLAGTQSDNGYYLDFGPHSFFSEDPEILKTVLDLFDSTLLPRRRDVKFYFRGKYLNYPLTPGDVLIQMGLVQGIRSGLSFLKGKIGRREKRNSATPEEMTVEEWALENFGEHLYSSFFKPYTEQFWKLPCCELSARTIPYHTRTNFINTLKVLLGRRATRQGDSLIEREQLPTYYPTTCFGEIAYRIADKIRAAGGKILLNSTACEVVLNGDRSVLVRYFCGRETASLECERLISTIPLPLFVDMVKPRPPADVRTSAARLEFRVLVVLGMVTERKNILGGSYMYVLNRPYNRISEMNKFSPGTSPPSDNIIAIEMPCLEDSPIWSASKEEIFQMSSGNLAHDGILLPGDVKKLLLVKAPYAYPVYRKDYAPHLKKVLAHVRSYPQLETLGRSGEFLYLDADMCMRRAFDLAAGLLKS